MFTKTRIGLFVAAMAITHISTPLFGQTNAYTLTYDFSPALTNGTPISGSYPGIADATVTHELGGGGVPATPDVFFWGGVSPDDGYGNLTNVAVGPNGSDVFAGVVITPNYPDNYVRLISFDMASKDDDGGDVGLTVYIQDDPYSGVIASPFVSAAGDVDSTMHTHVDFGGIPVTGPVNKGLAIFWPASEGRVAIDNVQFEIIGPPPPPRMIVTLPGETFTSGAGNGGTPDVQTAGVSFDLTLTVVNESLETDLTYNGTKTVSFSGPRGSPTYTTSVGFANGQATGVATTLNKAETTTISATDGVLFGEPGSVVTVGVGAFSQLQVLVPGEVADPGTLTGKFGTPADQEVGTTFDVTVNAVDAHWNLVSAAPNDTIKVVTSDPADTEPADNTLSNGSRTFSIEPVTVGALTVTATNISNGGIAPGTSAVVTVNPPFVTYPYTLDYEGLGLTSGQPIAGPYPGIEAATVTHELAVGGVPASPDVFFWGGVSPDNGYGNLTNVAVGPNGTNVFAGVIITPNNPDSYVRLSSFDMASKDDNGGDVALTVYIQDDPYSGLIASPFVSAAGDLDNTMRTHVDFGGTPVEGPANKGLAIFWPASEGRVAIDNVQFEIVGPAPEVTARNDFYTVAQGGALVEADPGVLGNDTAGLGPGPLTANLQADASNGTLSLNPAGGFAYNSGGTVGMDGFTYYANDGLADSTPGVALISVLPPGAFFYDNFERPAGVSDPFPWETALGTWTVSNGVLIGNAPLNSHGIAFAGDASLNGLTDYVVEATARLGVDCYEWGLYGRLDPATGAQYQLVQIPPGDSQTGQWALRLVKLRAWETPVAFLAPDVNLPAAPGVDPHTIKLIFEGNRILGYYDGALMVDFADTNAPYLSGGVSVGFYNNTIPSASTVLNVDEVIIQQLADTTTELVVATLEDVSTNLVLTGTASQGSALVFEIPDSPTHGVLSGFDTNTGALTYTPNANYFGADAFTYTADDGALVSTGYVTITVIAVDDPPAAESQTVSLDEDTSTDLVLSASDVDTTYTRSEVLGVVSTTSPDDWSLAAGASKVGAVALNDGNSSYIASGTAANTRQQFELADSVAIQGADTITSVTVRSTCRRESKNADYRVSMALGSDVVAGGTRTAKNNYVQDTSEFTERPGGGAWTVTDLQGLEARIENRQSRDMRCTQLDAVVNYLSTLNTTNIVYSILEPPTNGVLSGVDPLTGEVSYTPATNYAGADAFRFIATIDSVLTTGLVTIAVSPVNDAPVFDATPANVEVVELNLLSVTNSATDMDVPVQTLAYTLLEAPANAVVDTNGVIRWTPGEDQGPSSTTFVTVVSDGLASATNSFIVTVLDALPGPPVITSITWSGGSVIVAWTSISGYSYRLQYKDEFNAVGWTEQPVDVVGTGGTVTATNSAGGAVQRFYRVVQVE